MIHGRDGGLRTRKSDPGYGYPVLPGVNTGYPGTLPGYPEGTPGNKLQISKGHTGAYDVDNDIKILRVNSHCITESALTLYYSEYSSSSYSEILVHGKSWYTGYPFRFLLLLAGTPGSKPANINR
eukprot:744448-Rhodomonas_salina.1